MPTPRPDAEPRKRPRQDRSRATVERILVAAARIFDELGYQRATTNHVAEAAGVSIGSLYQYFPNKDALLVALAEQHLDEASAAFASRLAELRAAAPPLPDVVRELLALTLEANESTRLHALLFHEAPRTPALLARLHTLTEAVAAEVTHHLERAAAGGANPARRARLLVAMADAAVHEVVLAEPPGPARRTALDDLTAVLLHGLTHPLPRATDPACG